MAHIHSVYDTDHHFKIDPLTRAITTESKKVTLTQGDHNSERFTFELPRSIEGHDMKTCNKVQVHYINIDQLTREQSAGFYEVDDFDVSPEGDDTMILSWLIHGSATKYAGPLTFAVRFVCMSTDKVDYAWSTGIYQGVTISNGINNTEYVAEEFTDILQSWLNRIYTSASMRIETVSKATFDALAKEGKIRNDTLYLLKGIDFKIDDKVQVPSGSGIRHPDGYYTGFGFYDMDDRPRGTIMLTDTNCFHVNQQKTGSKYAERYKLPDVPEEDLDADRWYGIHTTKKPIAVGHGGTGGTTKEEAQESLDVPSLTKLKNGSTTVRQARLLDSDDRDLVYEDSNNIAKRALIDLVPKYADGSDLLGTYLVTFRCRRKNSTDAWINCVSVLYLRDVNQYASGTRCPVSRAGDNGSVYAWYAPAYIDDNDVTHNASLAVHASEGDFDLSIYAVRKIANNVPIPQS